MVCEDVVNMPLTVLEEEAALAADTFLRSLGLQKLETDSGAGAGV